MRKVPSISGYEKRSSSSLVILKSHPMLPAYFCHVPFMKISTSRLWNSMKVTFLKSNPFRFKETLDNMKQPAAILVLQYWYRYW